MKKLPFVLAFSGASGSIYGKDIFDRLHAAGFGIHLIFTKTATDIMSSELGLTKEYFDKENVIVHDNDSFEAPVASGSFLTGGMIVAPCSMGCLGRIASGVSMDLVGRAADVHLKERRPLILVPRETPLSEIHLENMLRVNRSGALVLPAMPGFTHKPKSIEQLASFITARVFDHLEIEQNFVPRYGS